MVDRYRKTRLRDHVTGRCSPGMEPLRPPRDWPVSHLTTDCTPRSTIQSQPTTSPLLWTRSGNSPRSIPTASCCGSSPVQVDSPPTGCEHAHPGSAESPGPTQSSPHLPTGQATDPASTALRPSPMHHSCRNYWYVLTTTTPASVKHKPQLLRLHRPATARSTPSRYPKPATDTKTTDTRRPTDNSQARRCPGSQK